MRAEQRPQAVIDPNRPQPPGSGVLAHHSHRQLDCPLWQAQVQQRFEYGAAVAARRAQGFQAGRSLGHPGLALAGEALEIGCAAHPTGERVVKSRFACKARQQRRDVTGEQRLKIGFGRVMGRRHRVSGLQFGGGRFRPKVKCVHRQHLSVSGERKILDHRFNCRHRYTAALGERDRLTTKS